MLDAMVQWSVCSLTFVKSRQTYSDQSLIEVRCLANGSRKQEGHKQDTHSREEETHTEVSTAIDFTYFFEAASRRLCVCLSRLLLGALPSFTSHPIFSIASSMAASVLVSTGFMTMTILASVST